MRFSPHLNCSDYILMENEAWKDEIGHSVRVSSSKLVTIHQASLVPSSFKSFIFNLNIRLCWSMKILPTGNSEIMYCNTNDYIWETVPGMCSLKKWILKENKNIVQPVRWWKTAGCIFEMGIELLRTAWVQGNEKKVIVL